MEIQKSAPTHFMPPQKVVFFAISFMVFSFVAILFFQFVVLQSKLNIKSYDDCVKAKGSTILESYPSICVARNGVRFIQPLTQEEQDAIKPPQASQDLQQFGEASSSARQVKALNGSLSFELPAGWILVQPNTSVEPLLEDVEVFEMMKADEIHLYPIGRVTIQHTRKENMLIPWSSSFEPEAQNIHGIDFLVTTGEESGEIEEGYEYAVYYAKPMGEGYAIRIFTRFQDEAARQDQRHIVESVQLL